MRRNWQKFVLSLVLSTCFSRHIADISKLAGICGCARKTLFENFLFTNLPVEYESSDCVSNLRVCAVAGN